MTTSQHFLAGSYHPGLVVLSVVIAIVGGLCRASEKQAEGSLLQEPGVAADPKAQNERLSCNPPNRARRTPIASHLICRSTQSRNVLYQNLLFCGFRTQWPSSGNTTSFDGTS